MRTHWRRFRKKNRKMVGARYFWALLLLTSSKIAWPVDDPSCRTFPADPQDPGALIKRGKYRGKCMDTSRKRPAVILQESAEELLVANFFHLGKFWTARIPRNAVARVAYQLARFDSPVPFGRADHSQVRFFLRPGARILLQAQEAPWVGGVGEVALDGLIVTTQYTAPTGVEYNAWDGTGPNFGMVTRLISARDRAEEQIKVDGSPVVQLELKFSDREKNLLLEEMIRYSHRNGLHTDYLLQERNCTSSIFEAIDAVGRKERASWKSTPFRMRWLDLLDPAYRPSLEALKARGLIDESSLMSGMEVEFPEWKVNPKWIPATVRL